MFVVNEMPEQLAPHLIRKLSDVEPATVGHFRHWGFMHPELRAAVPGKRVVGTAVTVRSPGNDSFMVAHVLGMVRPGDFLVVNRCGDRRHAAFGAVLALAAQKAGAVGVAIDGYACDLPEIREMGMPLWCLGASVVTHRRLALAGEINVPVACGDVTVTPGDAILADETGILVLRPDDVDSVADQALEMQRKEVITRQRLAAGEKISAIAGTDKLLAELMGKG